MLKRIGAVAAAICILNSILLISLVSAHAAPDESASGATQQTSVSATDASEGNTDNTVASYDENETSYTQPTTYVEPLKFPTLSVNAISNFFGKANADYNQYTKEVTVTFNLKASQGVLTTQWVLTYDDKVLKLDPEKNTPQTICPIVGDLGVLTFDKGRVNYNATSVDLFYFKSDNTTFVKLVFDVADIPTDEPQITKIDLTMDMLWLSNSKGKTTSVVNNFRVADLTKLDVSISKSTSLTESNYVAPTTAAPTTVSPSDGQVTPDEQNETQVSENPTASTDATSVTQQPSDPSGKKPQPSKPVKQKDKPKQPQKQTDNAAINTGEPLPAVLVLIVATAGMVALLIKRKKTILKLMLED